MFLDSDKAIYEIRNTPGKSVFDGISMLTCEAVSWHLAQQLASSGDFQHEGLPESLEAVKKSIKK